MILKKSSIGSKKYITSVLNDSIVLFEFPYKFYGFNHSICGEVKNLRLCLPPLPSINKNLNTSLINEYSVNKNKIDNGGSLKSLDNYQSTNFSVNDLDKRQFSENLQGTARPFNEFGENCKIPNESPSFSHFNLQGKGDNQHTCCLEKFKHKEGVGKQYKQYFDALDKTKGQRDIFLSKFQLETLDCCPVSQNNQYDSFRRSSLKYQETLPEIDIPQKDENICQKSQTNLEYMQNILKRGEGGICCDFCSIIDDTRLSQIENTTENPKCSKNANNLYIYNKSSVPGSKNASKITNFTDNTPKDSNLSIYRKFSFTERFIMPDFNNGVHDSLYRTDTHNSNSVLENDMNKFNKTTFEPRYLQNKNSNLLGFSAKKIHGSPLCSHHTETIYKSDNATNIPGISAEKCLSKHNNAYIIGKTSKNKCINPPDLSKDSHLKMETEFDPQKLINTAAQDESVLSMQEQPLKTSYSGDVGLKNMKYDIFSSKDTVNCLVDSIYVHSSDSLGVLFLKGIECKIYITEPVYEQILLNYESLPKKVSYETCNCNDFVLGTFHDIKNDEHAIRKVSPRKKKKSSDFNFLSSKTETACDTHKNIAHNYFSDESPRPYSSEKSKCLQVDSDHSFLVKSQTNGRLNDHKSKKIKCIKVCAKKADHVLKKQKYTVKNPKTHGSSQENIDIFSYSRSNVQSSPKQSHYRPDFDPQNTVKCYCLQTSEFQCHIDQKSSSNHKNQTFLNIHSPNKENKFESKLINESPINKSIESINSRCCLDTNMIDYSRYDSNMKYTEPRSHPDSLESSTNFIHGERIESSNIRNSFSRPCISPKSLHLNLNQHSNLTTEHHLNCRYTTDSNYRIVDIFDADIEGFKRKCIFIRNNEIKKFNEYTIQCISSGTFIGWCNYLIQFHRKQSIYIIKSILFSERLSLGTSKIEPDYAFFINDLSKDILIDAKSQNETTKDDELDHNTTKFNNYNLRDCHLKQNPNKPGIDSKNTGFGENDAAQKTINDSCSFSIEEHPSFGSEIAKLKADAAQKTINNSCSFSIEEHLSFGSEIAKLKATLIRRFSQKNQNSVNSNILSATASVKDQNMGIFFSPPTFYSKSDTIWQSSIYIPTTKSFSKNRSITHFFNEVDMYHLSLYGHNQNIFLYRKKELYQNYLLQGSCRNQCVFRRSKFENKILTASSTNSSLSTGTVYDKKRPTYEYLYKKFSSSLYHSDPENLVMHLPLEKNRHRMWTFECLKFENNNMNSLIKDLYNFDSFNIDRLRLFLGNLLHKCIDFVYFVLHSAFSLFYRTCKIIKSGILSLQFEIFKKLFSYFLKRSLKEFSRFSNMVPVCQDENQNEIQGYNLSNLKLIKSSNKKSFRRVITKKIPHINFHINLQNFRLSNNINHRNQGTKSVTLSNCYRSMQEKKFDINHAKNILNTDIGNYQNNNYDTLIYEIARFLNNNKCFEMQKFDKILINSYTHSTVVIPINFTTFFLELVFYVFEMFSSISPQPIIAICSPIFEKLKAVICSQTEWINEMFSNSAFDEEEPFVFDRYENLIVAKSIYDLEVQPGILFVDEVFYNFLETKIFENQIVVAVNNNVQKYDYNFNLAVNATYLNFKDHNPNVQVYSGNSFLDNCFYSINTKSQDVELKITNLQNLPCLKNGHVISTYVSGRISNYPTKKLDSAIPDVKKWFKTDFYFYTNGWYIFVSKKRKVKIENDTIIISELIL